MSQELVPESVVRWLETVNSLRHCEARERDRVKPVPHGDIRRIRRHLSKPVLALIDLQPLMGVRSGELVGLRATDFERTVKVWTFTPDIHKTAHHGKERVIPFGPREQASCLSRSRKRRRSCGDLNRSAD